MFQGRWEPLLLGLIVIAGAMAAARRWPRSPAALLGVGLAVVAGYVLGWHERALGDVPLRLPPFVGFMSIDDAPSIWLDPYGHDWPFTLWLDRQRYWSRTRLFSWLDPTTAPLAAALLLGWREEIDPEINDAFARTGTTHLLAVSGLQLQALAISLLLIFRVLGFPRRISYSVVGAIMIGYAMLVGPAPSVVRSTVMTSTFCLASIAQRLARSANTLSLAALCTLAVNPMNLFDVGCQLSFLAIGALVWLVSPACTLVRDIYEAIRSRIFGPRSRSITSSECSSPGGGLRCGKREQE